MNVDKIKSVEQLTEIAKVYLESAIGFFRTKKKPVKELPPEVTKESGPSSEDLIKYQKLILDIILRNQMKNSYRMLRESKQAVLDLINLRRKDLIDSITYKEHHTGHIARTALLEYEIDKVRAQLTDKFITGTDAKAIFAKNTQYVGEKIIHGEINLNRFGFTHLALDKIACDEDRLSKRELAIKAFSDKIISEAISLIKYNEEIKATAVSLTELDTKLSVVCSQHAIYGEKGNYESKMSSEYIDYLLGIYMTNKQSKDCPDGYHKTHVFFDDLHAKKTQYFENLATAFSKATAPKSKGNAK
ncbi:hypothetical protein [Pseudomonas sp. HY7a-MNA-CIBAN-0227]|uniref:hypothetical protein n=1 Tax=Pseudomonas sp. HY7a-MNA-CIBAN-0227 TaxID=3140474 RepID=UPI00331B00D6